MINTESSLNSLFVGVKYKILVLRSLLLSLCIYGCLDYCLPQEIRDYIASVHGGKYLYLTNMCLYFTVGTLVVGMSVRYFSCKGLVVSYINLVSVVLPLELLVTVLFWTLFLIDPTLVRDKDLYEQGVRVDLLSDLSMHLFPFIALLLEQYDIKIVREKSHVLFFSIFCVFYFLLCLAFSRANGFWVYPILDKLSPVGKIMLFAFSNLFVVAFYELFVFLSSKKTFFIFSKDSKREIEKK
ncbi:UPF0641 membrane protein [Nosema granulosis]|uniref:UPF0641 membrane protein n=1 Tax=Nosema granulosis TaxID=83296 RepID=A0A9P6KZS3_9MICR|nr:UPF0641 membrane protein [Nosema granulosis]